MTFQQQKLIYEGHIQTKVDSKQLPNVDAMSIDDTCIYPHNGFVNMYKNERPNRYWIPKCCSNSIANHYGVVPLHSLSIVNCAHA